MLFIFVMPSISDVENLPGFSAIDALAVLNGDRNGSSIQITESYFEAQRRSIDELAPVDGLEDRLGIIQRSRSVWNNISVDFDSLTEDALGEASTKLNEILQQLPEAQYLQQHFPGTSFIVPEWLRTEVEIKFGARVYFFGSDGPEPEEIVRKNIKSVMADDDEFTQYQGRLHGYPECCTEYFANWGSTSDPPEVNSVTPIEKHVNDEVVDEIDISVSLGEVMSDFFGEPHSYAFFAHEFYPEPECDVARRKGVAIYDSLTELLPENIVRDYFRVNFCWSYLMARDVESHTGSSSSKRLGREQFLMHLPLRLLVGQQEYASVS